MESTSVLDFTTVSNENTGGSQSARPGVYKFMLISEIDTTFLVLGPVREFGYHADLVDSFCSRRGIASAWVRKPDVVDVCDSRIRLIGGGWIKIHPDGEGVDIYGRSTAYGRFREETMRHIVATDPFFADMPVRIEKGS